MKLGISPKLLVNIDNAPLKLNCLLLKHPFDTKEDLLNRIITHYKLQGIRQSIFFNKLSLNLFF